MPQRNHAHKLTSQSGGRYRLLASTWNLAVASSVLHAKPGDSMCVSSGPHHMALVSTRSRERLASAGRQRTALGSSLRHGT